MLMKAKKLKDPASAITHFIGMVAAIIAAAPLLFRVWHKPDKIYFVSFAVYIIALFFSIRRVRRITLWIFQRR